MLKLSALVGGGGWVCSSNRNFARIEGHPSAAELEHSDICMATARRLT